MLIYHMNDQKKLVVLSGISGVGKSTIIKILLDQHDYHFSVSTTSRGMRHGEKHGKDYFFITRAEFQAMKLNNEFIEHVDFLEHSYGTTYIAITDNPNQKIILDLDYNGYQALKNRFSNVVGIFLHHNDLNEIKRRLLDRCKLSEITHDIQQRLDKAHIAASQRHIYDHVIDVTNMSVDAVLEAVLSACANEASVSDK